MTYSRWYWLFFPPSLAGGYGLITWYCWVALGCLSVAAKNGAVYVPYWEGQVIGFIALRLFVAVVISIVCFAVLPRRRWQPLLSGALAGGVMSVFDRYLFNWINYHVSFIAAFCAIPLIAVALVVWPLHLLLPSRTRTDL